MIAVPVVALFWFAAYVIGGWTAVLTIAAVGFIGELVLFTFAELPVVSVRRTVRRRWHAMEAHDRFRKVTDG